MWEYTAGEYGLASEDQHVLLHHIVEAIHNSGQPSLVQFLQYNYSQLRRLPNPATLVNTWCWRFPSTVFECWCLLLYILYIPVSCSRMSNWWIQKSAKSNICRRIICLHSRFAASISFSIRVKRRFALTKVDLLISLESAGTAEYNGVPFDHTRNTILVPYWGYVFPGRSNSRHVSLLRSLPGSQGVSPRGVSRVSLTQTATSICLLQIIIMI